MGRGATWTGGRLSTPAQALYRVMLPPRRPVPSGGVFFCLPPCGNVKESISPSLPRGGKVPPKGADEGKTVIPLQARKRIPFGEVLFSGEKYPKAAGDTGAEGPFQGQTPPFPRTPFRDASGGGGVQLPAELDSSCLPVRLSGFVPASPEQRYPPRLVSCCNSITLLNAASSLCLVLCSLPEQPCCILIE